MADDKTYSQAEVDALVAEREAGLKANRDEALKEAKKAKDALKAWDGVDPEEYKTLKGAAEEAERKRATSEGDFKTLEKQLVDKYEKQLGERDTEAKRLRGALEEYLIDSDALRELSEHSDSPALLLPHVKSRMQVQEHEGRFVTRIIDPSTGQVRIGKGQGSTPMTLGELVEEMKSDKTFALAFRGTGSSGGGASKTAAGGGGSKVVTAGDNDSFIANLADIASGKVGVAGLQ